VDRVEWVYIPDSDAAAKALIAGEVDYLENPEPDRIEGLKRARGIKVERLDPLGNQGMLRMNHLHPPFDDPRARQAMMLLMEQAAYRKAVGGNLDYSSECFSVYACGTSLASEAGADALKAADVERARRLFEEAGYRGQPVVILQPTDVPLIAAAGEVTAELLRKAGLKVELQEADWATLAAPAEGGWNILHTWWSGADILNPITHTGLAAGCVDGNAWVGWPCDAGLEALRNAFTAETNSAARRDLAEKIQVRAFEAGTHGIFGTWFNPVAYRAGLSGLLVSPVPLFWNVRKQ